MSALLDAAYKVGAPFEEVIARLLEKAPGTLTSEEKAFLRARREYLTEAQAKAFAIDDEDAVVEDEQSPERIALEEEATALGVKFNARTTDEKLAEKIAEAKA